MNWIITLVFTAPLVALAFPLSIAAQLGVVIVVLATSLTGRMVNQLVGLDDTFIEFVVGFAVLSHLLVAAELLAPGKSWTVIAFLSVLFLISYKTYTLSRESLPELGIAIFAAVFTFIWCSDLASRLSQFKQTGKLEFWIDILVHGTTISQFSATNSIGRGMELMADVPRPLYHIASYMPAALVSHMAQVPTLDTAVLIWIPFGILIMAAGILSIGIALGGTRLATLGLGAIAFLPNPEQLLLRNGFLGFSWLLETSPGIPYSLGVSSAAIAALVHWLRSANIKFLVLAILLTAACFFVRANTFVWLAPAVALTIILGVRQLSALQRGVIIVLGLLLLCVFLIVISWARISADPATFLFSYVEFIHQGVHAAYYANFYSWLVEVIGHPIAAILGVALILLGTLGPWLIIFVSSALLLFNKRKLVPFDAIPFIVLAVAAIFIILGPIPANGDISEFRHRAGPLLVVIISVWSLRFSALVCEILIQHLNSHISSALLFLISSLSIVTMMFNVAWSRTPKLNWPNVYNQQIDPLLFQAASTLKEQVELRPRFVVADQSRDARITDTAAVLAAFSEMPAYISCPQSLLMRDDAIGMEAERRMSVVDELKTAASLVNLKRMMQSEQITYYIVTSRDQAPFDPERTGAIWRSGPYAIYNSH